MTAPPPSFDWKDPANVQRWINSHARGNPQRAEHLALVLELLATLQMDGHRVLDLGCGDGIVAAMLLERFPTAHVTGVDSSPPMLDAAAARLAAYPGRWAVQPGALEALGALDLPAGGFDAAIGVQSIHHLSGDEKQALFRTVAGLLRPGGLFVLADRIMLTSAALFPYHRALQSWLQAQQGNPPIPAAYGYAEHLYALHARGDRPDTVEDQVTWLRAAGFGAAECFYRYLERAVFGGVKGAEDTITAEPDLAVLEHCDTIYAF